MKEKLQSLLEENKTNITEDIIKEIIEDENPLQSLLYIEEHGVEGGVIECLEFEKDSVKFFNKHSEEIDSLIKYMSQYGHNTSIPEGYSIKQHYANLAFKFMSFELYMNLVIEDL